MELTPQQFMLKTFTTGKSPLAPGSAILTVDMISRSPSVIEVLVRVIKMYIAPDLWKLAMDGRRR